MTPPAPTPDDGGEQTPMHNQAQVLCPYCFRWHPYPIAPKSEKHAALTRRTVNDPQAPAPLTDERKGYAETQILDRYGIKHDSDKAPQA